MEDQQLRVLIASALGRIIAPIIQQEISGSTVVAATRQDDLQRLIAHRVRYDAIVIDLTWSDYRVQNDFDGLDVLAVLRRHDRAGPVIFAAQGHGLERDHLQEALSQPEVVCVVQEADGPALLAKAVRAAAYRYPPPALTSVARHKAEGWSIDRYFSRPRSGITAARLAGAIASGQATDARSLAAVTGLGLNTVNKLVQQLGPLIIARGEHNPSLRMNSQVIYRWCGEHGCYIRSWCRRHGQGDVVGRPASAAI